MHSNGFLWVLISPYAFLLVFMSPKCSYKSLCVLMDINGSLWVLIGLFAFLWVLNGRDKFLCILIDSNGSLWFLIISFLRLYGF